MENLKFEECKYLDRKDFASKLEGEKTITLSVENEAKDVPGEEPRYDLDFNIISDERNFKDLLNYDEENKLTDCIINANIKKNLIEKYEEIEFENCIFVNQMSFYYSNKVIFNNCIFLSNINFNSIKTIGIFESSGETINISGKSSEIDIHSYGKYKSIFQKINLSIIESSIIEIIGIYIGTVRLHDVSTDILKLDRLNILIDLIIRKCFSHKEYSLTQNSLLNNSSLIINNTTLSASGDISFSDLSGTIEIYQSTINNCLLDYEKISKDKYKAIKKPISNKTEAKKVKWTFFNISKIYKQNGKIIESLETFNLSKKYERIENYKKRKNIGKILSFFENLPSSVINLTSGYFSSPVKVLITSVITILLFSFIYFCNIELLVSENILHEVYDSLYFSIITFVTIGYGDVSPEGILKIFAGVEGFIGVTLISILSVSFTRRYIQ